MKALQVELPAGWKEEDRRIMASISNKANKNIGPLKKLRQALSEEFSGWTVRSIHREYPDKFTFEEQEENNAMERPEIYS